MKKKTKTAQAGRRQGQLCALLACPNLRGTTCQASSDRIDASTLAAQESLALGLAGLGGKRTG